MTTLAQQQGLWIPFLTRQVRLSAHTDLRGTEAKGYKSFLHTCSYTPQHRHPLCSFKKLGGKKRGGVEETHRPSEIWRWKEVSGDRFFSKGCGERIRVTVLVMLGGKGFLRPALCAACCAVDAGEMDSGSCWPRGFKSPLWEGHLLLWETNTGWGFSSSGWKVIIPSVGSCFFPRTFPSF